MSINDLQSMIKVNSPLGLFPFRADPGKNESGGFSLKKFVNVSVDQEKLKIIFNFCTVIA
jgi:hypothetical protein